jgi:hypothetical protein
MRSFISAESFYAERRSARSGFRWKARAGVRSERQKIRGFAGFAMDAPSGAPALRRGAMERL